MPSVSVSHTHRIRADVGLRCLEIEVFDERFEVAVAEQQLMGILQAEGPDKDVNRLSDRDTPRTE
jgi:hypothetical protein